MATAMAVEIYPPGAIFSRDLDPLFMGIHPNITLMGSAGTAELFKNFSYGVVVAYFLSNVRIQAMVLVPGGVFLVSTVRVAPCAIVATWLFNNFPIFGLVHQFNGAATWEVSSVVIFIKNIRHSKSHSGSRYIHNVCNV